MKKEGKSRRVRLVKHENYYLNEILNLFLNLISVWCLVYVALRSSSSSVGVGTAVPIRTTVRLYVSIWTLLSIDVYSHKQ